MKPKPEVAEQYKALMELGHKTKADLVYAITRDKHGAVASIGVYASGVEAIALANWLTNRKEDE